MTRKYFILFLLIVGIATLVFNRINLDIYEPYSLIMDGQLGGLAVILLSIVAIFISKKSNVISLRVMMVFSVLLISSELFMAYLSLQEIQRIAYYKLYSSKTCDELIVQLERDKGQNEYAYFASGFAIDEEKIEEEFKNKYNVDIIVIGEGCSINQETQCYNLALLDFLESKTTNATNR